MRRDELILAAFLAAMVIAGVVYQEYRGAPKTAEVIITHLEAMPFEASGDDEPTIHAPPLQPDRSPFTLFFNRASKNELMELPGVGEAIAGRIIAYRERYGPFQRLDDLLEVDGIGAARLENFAEFLRDSLSASPAVPQIQPQPYAYPRGKISLNQATREQLMNVSGIGPSLADRILAERERRGRRGFQSWGEVDAVSGIGPARLQTLQENFTLGN